MKTLGIIVEYNPLHNGHVFHFQEAKKITNADAVIAVMSGNFLQRGEPAITNKWTRTEMALNMGVDLVIELPVAYACQPAEWFAYGAISALDQTGVVDVICFGSESGEIEWLKALAELLYEEPHAFKQLLKTYLHEGNNYPTAYSRAIEAFVLQSKKVSATIRSFLNQSPSLFAQLARPNNTLGLHYLIALKRIGSKIEPFTIVRKKAEYNEHIFSDEHIASATAIRKQWLASTDLSDLSLLQRFVPEYTLQLLQREYAAGRAPVTWDHFLPLLTYQLLIQNEMELSHLYEMTEGIEHRMKQAITRMQQGDTFENLLEQLRTKRFTMTKWQRTMVSVLLNRKKSDFTRENLAKGVPYLRVLGMSEIGQKLLKIMRTRAKVPIVHRVAKHDDPLLQQDIAASSIYSLAYKHHSGSDVIHEYTQSPLRFFSGNDAK